MPVAELLVQGRVLLQLVKAWWPTEQQQQQQQGASQKPPGDPAGNTAAAAAEAARAEQAARGTSVMVAAAAAAAEAAAAALQPLWSVTLQQWLSVGLLAQLLAVLGGSSTDLLQQDLKDRVVPLLQCYPHEQRILALQQLLVFWVAAAPAVAAAATAGSSASGSSASSGIVLAAALLAGETELLQLAAAASSLQGGRSQPGEHASPQGRGLSSQQQQAVAQAAAAAAGGDGSLGPLLWGGDVSAMVAAVLTAVSACKATNQWARIEQLLDAAADALVAAAAVHGLNIGAVQHAEQQQLAEWQARASSSSNSSSYGSADEGSEQQPGTQQEQEQQQQHRSRQQAAGSAGEGWDGWSSEGEDAEQEWHGGSRSSQQQQREAAALAATEPLRASVLQTALSRGTVQQLQLQLAALRGQVRAARLLTKHGCCVSIEQVAAADSRGAKEWLSQLLSRAER